MTGAARGIGLAIARVLGEAGANIMISDILADAAAKTHEDLLNQGLSAAWCAGDVSRADDVNRLFAAAAEKFGGVDILVNNAGITRDALLLRMEERDWDLVMAVNLKGAFLCSKAAARQMMKNRFGRIINISSVVGVMGNAGQANYSASKAGLIGLTKSLAKELAARNITVNAIAPGFIATEMTANLPKEALDKFLEAIPLGRPGTPADVAGAVKFLAGDDAGYITGQVIHVDGGMLM